MRMLPSAPLALDRRLAEGLLDISNLVGSVMELEDILVSITEIASRVMETQTCSIYMRDEKDPNFLYLAASKGLSMAQELGIRGFPMGEGVPGWAALHNETVWMRNDQEDPRYARLDDTAKEAELKAYMCTPLRIQLEVIGIISFRRARLHDWTPEEIIFAEIIAKQVSIVVEKARLYRKMREADRLAAIAISLSEVAHYIKNVLQSMTGGAYFVETGLKRGDMPKALQGWELHKKATEKIKSLVENMLMFSREKRCELEEGDINSLLASLAQSVEETAFQRGIKVELVLAPKVPVLMLDRDSIHDAVLNLVMNAMDAIDTEQREGLIQLVSRVDHAGRKVILQVVDNGGGIPEEAQPKMFNLFFSTKGRGGTGIGLAVTRKIIEEHGGRIWFDTRIREGTTFSIELPVGG